ncbi:MAG: SLBB domain-containing protein [candidate division WOR-3 bacterium]
MKKLIPFVLAIVFTIGLAQKTEPGTTLSVRAAVWGQVKNPGLYSLSGSPDLFELISAAGGPTSGADITRVLVIREQDRTRHRVNLLYIAQSGKPFFLTAGDVVIVPESFWNQVKNTLPVIHTALTVTNLVITLLLLTK